MNNLEKSVYAILADNVYWDVRYGQKRDGTLDTKYSNWTPVPSGWKLIDEKRDEASGFTARAFEHSTTGEIVISYAGTNPQPDTPDYIADINMGLGVASQQANLAAQFFHKVKSAVGDDTDIKFTGHSLGGGLAGLMGILFDKAA